MITPDGAAPRLAPVGAALSLLACALLAWSGAKVHGVSVSALVTA
jgi:hypothetical protein